MGAPPARPADRARLRRCRSPGSRVKRAIPKGYGWQLAGLFVLGGAQGALGWYMVMSGLEGRTDVSHFRLSAHLLLALSIMGALIWVALDLRRLAATGGPAVALHPAGGGHARDPVRPADARRLGRRASTPAMSPTDWPLTARPLLPRRDRLVARHLWALTHDPFLLHFIHRWWAWVVVAALVLFARQVRKPIARAGLDRHPLGVRHPDHPRHPDRADRASRSGSPRFTRRPAHCSSPRRCGVRTSSEDAG